MSYFRRRNNLVVEYSGYQEVSTNLRNRLYQILTRYISKYEVGIGQGNLWVRGPSLEHELYVEMCKSDLSAIILQDSYENVFTAVEIFLTLAEKQAWERYRKHILPDVSRAFALSGSVYFVNDEGRINLKTDEELVEKIEQMKEVLSSNEPAYTRYFNAVGNLMGRKDSPENIVKDIFIAFEDYLKNKTGKNEFGQAVDYLKTNNIITSTQKALIDKLYAYRSDVKGAAHAGNSKNPDEIDTLWYLETVTSQIKLIDRRINEKS